MLQGPKINFPAAPEQPSIPGRESTQRRQRRKLQALDEKCYTMERELTRQAGIIRRLREEHHRKESLFEQEREYMRSKVEEVRREYQEFAEKEERRRCWEDGKMKAELQRLREELEECRGDRRRLGLEVFKLVAEKKCRGVE